MSSEVEHRISFLSSGPWTRSGARARDILKKPSDPREAAQCQQRLTEILRPHWDAAITKAEGLIRDSFDEALTTYQLFELAIRSGYIAVADIEQRVARDFSEILWSAGARRYLYTYNYAGVVCLAQRAGVDIGFEPVGLPPINGRGEGTFAAFLSQHREWYEDPLLDGWLGFLDDYQVLQRRRTDKEILLSFLTDPGSGTEDEARLWGLVAGAESFLTRLSDTYQLIPPNEREPYAAFYSYWLAKFYGERPAPDFPAEEASIDWSGVLLGSERIRRIDTGSHGEGQLNSPTLLESLSNLNANVSKLWSEAKSLGSLKMRLRH